MVEPIDAGHEWATEIGRIVVAFGGIEHVTTTCLRVLPHDPIHVATGHLNLGPRLDLLVAVLSGRQTPGEQHLASLLEQAKKLAEERNLIVHNPLVLDVYEAEDGQYTFKKSIQSLKRVERHLSLADVVRIREQAERLATDLYNTAAPLLAPNANDSKS